MPQFPSNLTASGIWTLKKQKRAKQGSNWPPLFPSDPQFNYVTMLLHGNGTNGAQNNTFLDSSTNNFTITRNGNTTQGTFAPFGSNWSNYFPGATGTWLSAPNNAAFQFGTGDLTIEAWIFLTGNTVPDPNGNRSAAICAGIGATGVSNDFWLSVDGNSTTTGTGVNLSNWTSGSYAAPVAASFTIPQNTWHHIAVSRSGNTMRLFFNGALMATNTYTGAITAGTNALTIGYAQTGTNNNFNLPFPGYISNLRIVKGTAVYTSNFTPSTSPLTAITNTSLLTCQSNRFIDNSTNAFTITRNGDTSVQRFSPFNPTAPYAAGTDGGSGYFDGSGDSLQAPSGACVSGTGDFTAECWIFPTVVPGTYNIIACSDATGGLTMFGLNSNGTIFMGRSLIDVQATSSNSLLFNTWNHIAVSRSSGTVKLFINGTQGYSGSITTNYSSGTVRIGTDGGGSALPYTGYISNLRIIPGTALYTAAFTPPTSPLTAITNTSLLLSYTNGGIIDNAMMNDLETVGNAQISTAQSKFGGASMLFDGNGDWLQIPLSDPVNFGTGSFTIEMWVNPSTTNHQSAGLFTQQHISAQNSPISICMFLNGGDFESVGNGISFGVYGGFTNGGNWVFVQHNLATIPINTWTHVALVRNGNVFTMYVNGTSVGSATSTTSCFIGNTPYFIGRRWDLYGDYPYYNGYMDEVRVSKFARYTSNFSVPTRAFPDQGL